MPPQQYSQSKTGDFLRKLEEQEERDRQFRQKLIEILKENGLGTKEEITYLEGLHLSL